MKHQPKNIGELSHNERHLIKAIRAVEYGEIRIQVKQSEPYRIERISESVMLGSFDEDDIIP